MKNSRGHYVIIPILIVLFILSCNTPKTKVVYDDTKYLRQFVPTFEFEPSDSIIYLLREDVKTTLPVEYEYYMESKFMLIGKGDSSLNSVDFKYLAIDWTWIQEGDTIKISTLDHNAFINKDVLLTDVLNIKYDLSITDATNWEEFYLNIKEEIFKVKDQPQEIQQCLYEFYNTIFNSNWIRAKVRQIFRFGPEYVENPYEKFEIGAKWTYNLPIEYDAKSLHQVANSCVIDSITPDKIWANITGELYGQPKLITPGCIHGKMIIDRQKKKLQYINIEQHMRCEEVPSLNYKKYINRPDAESIDPYKIQEVKFDKLLNIELTLME